MKICFASHNSNKIKELKKMLHGRHEIYGLEEINIHDEIAETGLTIEENSLIKAKFIFDRLNIPVIADDSGLLVEDLNGEPGVYSARYAGPEKDDFKNIDLLLSKLGNSTNRKAHFITVITYLNAEGKTHQFSGQVNGEIISERKGSNGFGYDPIFKPDGYDLTFAELSSEVKNQISHRGIAVKKLIEHLHHSNE